MSFWSYNEVLGYTYLGKETNASRYTTDLRYKEINTLQIDVKMAVCSKGIMVILAQLT